MQVPPVPRARDRQDAWRRRALAVMPGGTDSNFRIWDDQTVYVDRGKGARIWDLDGGSVFGYEALDSAGRAVIKDGRAELRA